MDPNLADPSALGEAMQYPGATQPANSPPVIYQIEWRERKFIRSKDRTRELHHLRMQRHARYR
jgi:hypothetical protein